MAATTTSCGVLLLNPERELLLCHATGAAHWDIPKGLGEPGEAARDTALRELFEETGLRLQPDRLLDLGAMTYRPGKDLHLFAMWSERLDLSGCHCNSQFTDRRGRLMPEVDAFEWTPFARVSQRCAKNMATVLTERLSLEEVWLTVKDRAPDPHRR